MKKNKYLYAFILVFTLFSMNLFSQTQKNNADLYSSFQNIEEINVEKECFKYFSPELFNDALAIIRPILQGKAKCLKNSNYLLFQKLNRYYKSGAIKIICQDLNNKSILARGSADGKSINLTGENKYEIFHPFILLNTQFGKDSDGKFLLNGLSTVDGFASTILHELIHNAGNLHREQPDLNYSCTDCCFNADKIIQDNSCELCSASINGAKKFSGQYFRKAFIYSTNASNLNRDINPAFELNFEIKYYINEGLKNSNSNYSLNKLLLTYLFGSNFAFLYNDDKKLFKIDELSINGPAYYFDKTGNEFKDFFKEFDLESKMTKSLDVRISNTSKLYNYMKDRIDEFPEYNFAYFTFIAKSYQDLVTNEKLDHEKYILNLLNDENFELQEKWLESVRIHKTSIPINLQFFCNFSSDIYDFIYDKYMSKKDGEKTEIGFAIPIEFQIRALKLFASSVECELNSF